MVGRILNSYMLKGHVTRILGLKPFGCQNQPHEVSHPNFDFFRNKAGWWVTYVCVGVKGQQKRKVGQIPQLVFPLGVNVTFP